ncbi:YeeE/YedE thiosulfate transporter family protein [Sedimenticola hydrogenitrophicus]|uniref:YeeE/YedE thiosulfate transporter family protein n=1 Tax=Sedimenticola hydrogenitrophicus TaxID=2967975 RepID=UPI0021A4E585|nr:YeeE/YedE thiosulfate transporter family protein [Sedimenticola hydrogenitrophicus]
MSSMQYPFSLLWAAPLVAFLGYAAHRASLCTVRAVADVLESRRFERFGGFLRAVLWAMLLTLPALLLMPNLYAAPAPTAPLWVGLGGGFLFGLGAALNGGCSFSTLQRLADADWRMLATLAGFISGVAAWQLAPPLFTLNTPPGLPSPAWLMAALALLVIWGGAEIRALWPHRHGLRERLGADAYSPRTTAVLLGLGAGALYLGFGPWTYTYTLRGSVSALAGGPVAPPATQLLLVPVLLLGMMISAWRRGAWHKARPATGWTLNLGGGLLMGLGGALIPGGNDTLLLRLIPTLTPHSLWIYLMLVGGVAGGLLLKRAVLTPAPAAHRPDDDRCC